MKYDWSKAPKEAIAAFRDKDASAYWVRLTPSKGFWDQKLWDMDYSAILDDSCNWRESLELRPREPTP